MRVGVASETAQGERRVALVPDSVARLTKSGIEVLIQAGAGEAAFFADEAYLKAGAKTAASMAELFAADGLILKVQRPNFDEARALPANSTIVGLMQPAVSGELFALLAERKVTALAMELVPRISAAQRMDALSSQATVAGYKAMLLGAGACSRLMPMMITAAGTLVPSRVFILGAGVAGLQAIATARRLGAIVSAFDVRAVARQDVESLGATFVAADEAPKDAEAAGGYARELAADEQRRVLDAIGRHLPEMDVVITTAQVPGRPAPRLITAEMVSAMKHGSVIVDLAAETGGNCALTKPGERIDSAGVTIFGTLNLAASVPTHASQMYSRNLENLLQYMKRDGKLVVDLEDRITGPMVVTHQGEVRYH